MRRIEERLKTSPFERPFESLVAGLGAFDRAGVAAPSCRCELKSFMLLGAKRSRDERARVVESDGCRPLRDCDRTAGHTMRLESGHREWLGFLFLRWIAAAIERLECCAFFFVLAAIATSAQASLGKSGDSQARAPHVFAQAKLINSGMQTRFASVIDAAGVTGLPSFAPLRPSRGVRCNVPCS